MAMAGVRKATEERKKKVERLVWCDHSAIAGDATECSICVDCMSLTDRDHPVGVLSCGHAFHKKCIKEALTYHFTCPHCRGAPDVKPEVP